jgi:F-type H+-transporting ATPase subunit epsilon
MAQELQVEIASTTRIIWRGAATYLSVPTTRGPVGVYPRHEPFLALLAAGQMRIDAVEGEAVRVDLTGFEVSHSEKKTQSVGFLSIDDNHVTVVVDHGEVVGSE